MVCDGLVLKTHENWAVSSSLRSESQSGLLVCWTRRDSDFEALPGVINVVKNFQNTVRQSYFAEIWNLRYHEASLVNLIKLATSLGKYLFQYRHLPIWDVLQNNFMKFRCFVAELHEFEFSNFFFLLGVGTYVSGVLRRCNNCKLLRIFQSTSTWHPRAIFRLWAKVASIYYVSEIFQILVPPPSWVSFLMRNFAVS